MSQRHDSTGSTRQEGDISSAFVSLSGDNGETPPLPSRYADLKRRLIEGREPEIKRSWDRLLCKLREEVKTVRTHASSVIPSIEFRDIENPSTSFQEELRKRGVAVIRGVVPEDEARSYKEDIEEYVRVNPFTKGTQPVTFRNENREMRSEQPADNK